MGAHVFRFVGVSPRTAEQITLLIFSVASLATIAGMFTGQVSPNGAVFVGGGLLIAASLYFALVSRHRHTFPAWSIALPLFVLGLVAVVGRMSGVFLAPEPITTYEDHFAMIAATLFLIWIVGFWALLEYYLLPLYEDVDLSDEDED